MRSQAINRLWCQTSAYSDAYIAHYGGNLDVQSLSDALNIVQRHIVFASLDATCVTPIKASRISKRLLGQIPAHPQLTHG
jgi:hypothetical protein